MSKLAIVITVHNRNDVRLKNCLRSLVAQQTSHEYEVYVVDYGSTDDLPSMIGEIASDKILYVHVDQEPLNKSHGNNIAIKATEADYICVTDGYLIFQSNFVDAAINEMGNNLIAVSTARPFYLPEVYQNQQVDPVEDFHNCLHADGCGRGPVRPQSHLMVMERSRLMEIRGYDEAIPYAEDIDMLHRMLASGAFLTRLDDDTSFIYQTFTMDPEEKRLKGRRENECIQASDAQEAFRRKSPIRNLGEEFGVL